MNPRIVWREITDMTEISETAFEVVGEVGDARQFEKMLRVQGIARRKSLQDLARIGQPVQLLVRNCELPQAGIGSASLSIYRFEQCDYQGGISARFKHRQYRRDISLGEARIARQPL